MAVLINGPTVSEAWRRGSEALIQTPGHIIRNMITEIEDPTTWSKVLSARFDPKCVGAADRLSVVAKVLFPEHVRPPSQPRAEFYDRWAKILKRARQTGRLHSSWGGTYFERLLSLNGSENQIERAIRVLSSWRNRSETAIVAHLSTPVVDGLRPRGSPCLQYIEILWKPDNSIDLVALYRNHDFLNKTLGNFVGLGRLLKFIALEGNKRPGRVICHSVRAYTDQVGQLRRLIAR
jgi:thymidylate synthase